MEAGASSAPNKYVQHRQFFQPKDRGFVHKPTATLPQFTQADISSIAPQTLVTPKPAAPSLTPQPEPAQSAVCRRIGAISAGKLQSGGGFRSTWKSSKSTTKVRHPMFTQRSYRTACTTPMLSAPWSIPSTASPMRSLPPATSIASHSSLFKQTEVPSLPPVGYTPQREVQAGMTGRFISTVQPLQTVKAAFTAAPIATVGAFKPSVEPLCRALSCSTHYMQATSLQAGSDCIGSTRDGLFPRHSLVYSTRDRPLITRHLCTQSISSVASLRPSVAQSRPGMVSAGRLRTRLQPCDQRLPHCMLYTRTVQAPLLKQVTPSSSRRIRAGKTANVQQISTSCAIFSRTDKLQAPALRSLPQAVHPVSTKVDATKMDALHPSALYQQKIRYSLIEGTLADDTPSKPCSIRYHPPLRTIGPACQIADTSCLSSLGPDRSTLSAIATPSCRRSQALRQRSGHICTVPSKDKSCRRISDSVLTSAKQELSKPHAASLQAVISRPFTTSVPSVTTSSQISKHVKSLPPRSGPLEYSRTNLFAAICTRQIPNVKNYLMCAGSDLLAGADIEAVRTVYQPTRTFCRIYHRSVSRGEISEEKAVRARSQVFATTRTCALRRSIVAPEGGNRYSRPLPAPAPVPGALPTPYLPQGQKLKPVLKGRASSLSAICAGGLLTSSPRMQTSLVATSSVRSKILSGKMSKMPSIGEMKGRGYTPTLPRSLQARSKHSLKRPALRRVPPPLTPCAIRPSQLAAKSSLDAILASKQAPCLDKAILSSLPSRNFYGDSKPHVFTGTYALQARDMIAQTVGRPQASRRQLFQARRSELQQPIAATLVRPLERAFPRRSAPYSVQARAALGESCIAKVTGSTVQAVQSVTSWLAPSLVHKDSLQQSSKPLTGYHMLKARHHRGYKGSASALMPSSTLLRSRVCAPIGTRALTREIPSVATKPILSRRKVADSMMTTQCADDTQLMPSCAACPRIDPKCRASPLVRSIISYAKPVSAGQVAYVSRITPRCTKHMHTLQRVLPCTARLVETTTATSRPGANLQAITTATEQHIPSVASATVVPSPGIISSESSVTSTPKHRLLSACIGSLRAPCFGALYASIDSLPEAGMLQARRIPQLSSTLVHHRVSRVEAVITEIEGTRRKDQRVFATFRPAMQKSIPRTGVATYSRPFAPSIRSRESKSTEQLVKTLQGGTMSARSQALALMQPPRWPRVSAGLLSASLSSSTLSGLAKPADQQSGLSYTSVPAPAMCALSGKKAAVEARISKLLPRDPLTSMRKPRPAARSDATSLATLSCIGAPAHERAKRRAHIIRPCKTGPKVQAPTVSSVSTQGGASRILHHSSSIRAVISPPSSITSVPAPASFQQSRPTDKIQCIRELQCTLAPVRPADHFITHAFTDMLESPAAVLETKYYAPCHRMRSLAPVPNLQAMAKGEIKRLRSKAICGVVATQSPCQRPPCYKHAGFLKRQLKGQTASQIMSPASRPCARAIVQRAMKTPVTSERLMKPVHPIVARAPVTGSIDAYRNQIASLVAPGTQTDDTPLLQTMQEFQRYMHAPRRILATSAEICKRKAVKKGHYIIAQRCTLDSCSEASTRAVLPCPSMPDSQATPGRWFQPLTAVSPGVIPAALVASSRTRSTLPCPSELRHLRTCSRRPICQRAMASISSSRFASARNLSKLTRFHQPEQDVVRSSMTSSQRLSAISSANFVRPGDAVKKHVAKSLIQCIVAECLPRLVTTLDRARRKYKSQETCIRPRMRSRRSVPSAALITQRQHVCSRIKGFEALRKLRTANRCPHTSENTAFRSSLLCQRGIADISDAETFVPQKRAVKRVRASSVRKIAADVGNLLDAFARWRGGIDRFSKAAGHQRRSTRLAHGFQKCAMIKARQSTTGLSTVFASRRISCIHALCPPLRPRDSEQTRNGTMSYAVSRHRMRGALQQTKFMHRAGISSCVTPCRLLSAQFRSSSAPMTSHTRLHTCPGDIFRSTLTRQQYSTVLPTSGAFPPKPVVKARVATSCIRSIASENFPTLATGAISKVARQGECRSRLQARRCAAVRASLTHKQRATALIPAKVSPLVSKRAASRPMQQRQLRSLNALTALATGVLGSDAALTRFNPEDAIYPTPSTARSISKDSILKALFSDPVDYDTAHCCIGSKVQKPQVPSDLQEGTAPQQKVLTTVVKGRRLGPAPMLSGAQPAPAPMLSGAQLGPAPMLSSAQSSAPSPLAAPIKAVSSAPLQARTMRSRAIPCDTAATKHITSTLKSTANALPPSGRIRCARAKIGTFRRKPLPTQACHPASTLSAVMQSCIQRRLRHTRICPASTLSALKQSDGMREISARGDLQRRQTPTARISKSIMRGIVAACFDTQPTTQPRAVKTRASAKSSRTTCRRPRLSGSLLPGASIKSVVAPVGHPEQHPEQNLLRPELATQLTRMRAKVRTAHLVEAFQAFAPVAASMLPSTQGFAPAAASIVSTRSPMLCPAALMSQAMLRSRTRCAPLRCASSIRQVSTLQTAAMPSVERIQPILAKPKARIATSFIREIASECTRTAATVKSSRKVYKVESQPVTSSQTSRMAAVKHITSYPGQLYARQRRLIASKLSSIKRIRGVSAKDASTNVRAATHHTLIPHSVRYTVTACRGRAHGVQGSFSRTLQEGADAVVATQDATHQAGAAPGLQKQMNPLFSEACIAITQSMDRGDFKKITPPTPKPAIEWKPEAVSAPAPKKSTSQRASVPAPSISSQRRPYPRDVPRTSIPAISAPVSARLREHGDMIPGLFPGDHCRRAALPEVSKSWVPAYRKKTTLPQVQPPRVKAVKAACHHLITSARVRCPTSIQAAPLTPSLQATTESYGAVCKVSSLSSVLPPPPKRRSVVKPSIKAVLRTPCAVPAQEASGPTAPQLVQTPTVHDQVADDAPFVDASMTSLSTQLYNRRAIRATVSALTTKGACMIEQAASLQAHREATCARIKQGTPACASVATTAYKMSNVSQAPSFIGKRRLSSQSYPRPIRSVASTISTFQESSDAVITPAPVRASTSYKALKTNVATNVVRGIATELFGTIQGLSKTKRARPSTPGVSQLRKPGQKVISEPPRAAALRTIHKQTHYKDPRNLTEPKTDPASAGLTAYVNPSIGQIQAVSSQSILAPRQLEGISHVEPEEQISERFFQGTPILASSTQSARVGGIVDASDMQPAVAAPAVEHKRHHSILPPIDTFQETSSIAGRFHSFFEDSLMSITTSISTSEARRLPPPPPARQVPKWEEEEDITPSVQPLPTPSTSVAPASISTSSRVASDRSRRLPRVQGLARLPTVKAPLRESDEVITGTFEGDHTRRAALPLANKFWAKITRVQEGTARLGKLVTGKKVIPPSMEGMEGCHIFAGTTRSRVKALQPNTSRSCQSFRASQQYTRQVESCQRITAVQPTQKLQKYVNGSLIRAVASECVADKTCHRLTRCSRRRPCIRSRKHAAVASTPMASISSLRRTLQPSQVSEGVIPAPQMMTSALAAQSLSRWSSHPSFKTSKRPTWEVHDVKASAPQSAKKLAGTPVVDKAGLPALSQPPRSRVEAKLKAGTVCSLIDTKSINTALYSHIMRSCFQTQLPRELAPIPEIKCLVKAVDVAKPLVKAAAPRATTMMRAVEPAPPAWERGRTFTKARLMDQPGRVAASCRILQPKLLAPQRASAAPSGTVKSWRQKRVQQKQVAHLFPSLRKKPVDSTSIARKLTAASTISTVVRETSSISPQQSVVKSVRPPSQHVMHSLVRDITKECMMHSCKVFSPVGAAYCRLSRPYSEKCRKVSPPEELEPCGALLKRSTKVLARKSLFNRHPSFQLMPQCRRAGLVPSKPCAVSDTVCGSIKQTRLAPAQFARSTLKCLTQRSRHRIHAQPSLAQVAATTQQRVRTKPVISQRAVVSAAPRAQDPTYRTLSALTAMTCATGMYDAPLMAPAVPTPERRVETAAGANYMLQSFLAASSAIEPVDHDAPQFFAPSTKRACKVAEAPVSPPAVPTPVRPKLQPITSAAPVKAYPKLQPVKSCLRKSGLFKESSRMTALMPSNRTLLPRHSALITSRCGRLAPRARNAQFSSSKRHRVSSSVQQRISSSPVAQAVSAPVVSAKKQVRATVIRNIARDIVTEKLCTTTCRQHRQLVSTPCPRRITSQISSDVGSSVFTRSNIRTSIVPAKLSGVKKGLSSVSRELSTRRKQQEPSTIISRLDSAGCSSVTAVLYSRLMTACLQSVAPSLLEAELVPTIPPCIIASKVVPPPSAVVSATPQRLLPTPVPSKKAVRSIQSVVGQVFATCRVLQTQKFDRIKTRTSQRPKLKDTSIIGTVHKSSLTRSRCALLSKVPALSTLVKTPKDSALSALVRSARFAPKCAAVKGVRARASHANVTQMTSSVSSVPQAASVTYVPQAAPIKRRIAQASIRSIATECIRAVATKLQKKPYAISGKEQEVEDSSRHAAAVTAKAPSKVKSAYMHPSFRTDRELKKIFTGPQPTDEELLRSRAERSSKRVPKTISGDPVDRALPGDPAEKPAAIRSTTSTRTGEPLYRALPAEAEEVPRIIQSSLPASAMQPARMRQLRRFSGVVQTQASITSLMRTQASRRSVTRCATSLPRLSSMQGSCGLSSTRITPATLLSSRHLKSHRSSCVVSSRHLTSVRSTPRPHTMFTRSRCSVNSQRLAPTPVASLRHSRRVRAVGHPLQNIKEISTDEPKQVGTLLATTSSSIADGMGHSEGDAVGTQRVRAAKASIAQYSRPIKSMAAEGISYVLKPEGFEPKESRYPSYPTLYDLTEDTPFMGGSQMMQDFPAHLDQLCQAAKQGTVRRVKPEVQKFKRPARVAAPKKSSLVEAAPGRAQKKCITWSHRKPGKAASATADPQVSRKPVKAYVHYKQLQADWAHRRLVTEFTRPLISEPPIAPVVEKAEPEDHDTRAAVMGAKLISSEIETTDYAEVTTVGSGGRQRPWNVVPSLRKLPTVIAPQELGERPAVLDVKDAVTSAMLASCDIEATSYTTLIGGHALRPCPRMCSRPQSSRMLQTFHNIPSVVSTPKKPEPASVIVYAQPKVQPCYPKKAFAPKLRTATTASAISTVLSTRSRLQTSALCASTSSPNRLPPVRATSLHASLPKPADCTVIERCGRQLPTIQNLPTIHKLVSPTIHKLVTTSLDGFLTRAFFKPTNLWQVVPTSLPKPSKAHHIVKTTYKTRFKPDYSAAVTRIVEAVDNDSSMMQAGIYAPKVYSRDLVKPSKLPALFKPAPEVQTVQRKRPVSSLHSFARANSLVNSFENDAPMLEAGAYSIRPYPLDSVNRARHIETTESIASAPKSRSFLPSAPLIPAAALKAYSMPPVRPFKPSVKPVRPSPAMSALVRPVTQPEDDTLPTSQRASQPVPRAALPPVSSAADSLTSIIRTVDTSELRSVRRQGLYSSRGSNAERHMARTFQPQEHPFFTHSDQMLDMMRGMRSAGV